MSHHQFYGSPERFQIIADFIADRYWKKIKYIADVAGGQGMLSRILTKKYNYVCEVVDPRGWVLKGVGSRDAEFDPAWASYYDLIVGLHPDEALRPVVLAALARPTLVVPCCNFWSEEKLGCLELVEAVENYYRDNGVNFERITFPFKGPKNIGILSKPRQA